MVLSSKILLVDDDPALKELLREALQGKGYEVDSAANGLEAIEIVGKLPPDLILLDVMMPEMGGFETLEALRAKDLDIPVIMLTGNGSIPDAIRAIRMGAEDYLEKPVPIARLLLTVEHTMHIARLSEENQKLRVQLGDILPPDGLVGQSSPMRKIFQMISRIGDSTSTVLITGESGTGKELVARAIHSASPRKDKPFIAINCSAIPESLLESELFGHERGAFTDADKRRKGRFEMAEKGTLFLDEVGDLSAHVQVRLLRFLQEKTFERVGGNETHYADIRILSATNQELRKRIAEEKFRGDLYYRLNVVALDLPPLRNRKGDIPMLGAHFLKKYAKANGREGLSFSPETLDSLERYEWPGNVRELEHAIERAVILSPGDVIGMEMMPDELKIFPLSSPAPAVSIPNEDGLGKVLREIEIQMIERALQENGMVQSKAAAQLQISERMLSYKIHKYEIQNPRGRRRKSSSRAS